jgi:hypothetical protein
VEGFQEAIISKGGNKLKGYLYCGKLTYVDTDEGKIGITEKDEDIDRIFSIDEKTEYDTRGGWRNSCY